MMRPLAGAAVAGVVAALAYLAEQEIDRRLWNPRSHDLDLLGGMLTRNRQCWRPLGFIMHLGAGATFGIIFDRGLGARLPGPYWFRGLLAAQVENVALWPLVLLLDRVHPAVRMGVLAPLHRRAYFLQAVLRHAAFGTALGALLDPERDGEWCRGTCMTCW